MIGQPKNVSEPILIAGGNCTLQGFNQSGEDAYWTVTGDVVCSLAMVDYTGDGMSDDLIVGSEDFEIRVFEGEDIFSEITESDAITYLRQIEGEIDEHAESWFKRTGLRSS